RARTALLMVQATLSVVVVAGSTMLARSLVNLEHQDFGYEVQGRVMVSLKRLPATYTIERLSSLYRDIEQRLAGLPGVRGAGLALSNPLTSGSGGETIFVAGHPPNASNESGASWDRVSADYLQNLGVTIVRGRLFTAADNESAAPVAVVNETFVKRFFKDGEDPLDQHFGIEGSENAGTFRIVGIARDAKFARPGLNEPALPMFFVPLAQRVEYKSHQRGERGAPLHVFAADARRRHAGRARRGPRQRDPAAAGRGASARGAQARCRHAGRRRRRHAHGGPALSRLLRRPRRPHSSRRV